MPNQTFIPAKTLAEQAASEAPGKAAQAAARAASAPGWAQGRDDVAEIGVILAELAARVNAMELEIARLKAQK